MAMKIDRLTKEQVKESINGIDVGEELKELVKDIHTLTQRIADLVEDKKALSCAVNLGVVVCVASAGTPDMVATMGTPLGIATASIDILQELAKMPKGKGEGHEDKED